MGCAILINLDNPEYTMKTSSLNAQSPDYSSMPNQDRMATLKLMKRPPAWIADDSFQSKQALSARFNLNITDRRDEMAHAPLNP